MTRYGIKSAFCAAAAGKSFMRRHLCQRMISHSAWIATTISMLKSVQPAPNPSLALEVPSSSAFKTASGTVSASTVESARSPWLGKDSWPRTWKSYAASVALEQTLTCRKRQVFPHLKSNLSLLSLNLELIGTNIFLICILESSLVWGI